jgi:hypothetical protein
LRQRVAGSDFGDPVRYARAVEAAYRNMWQRWSAQAERDNVGNRVRAQPPDLEIAPARH